MLKSEDKNFMFASVKDKINLAKKRNKIQNTCFFTQAEKTFAEKELIKSKENNYFFFGGYDEAERVALIAYPEKFDTEIVKENLDNIFKVIKIVLPNELAGAYNHSSYLASLMKIGLERERFGDIICFENEAYVVVLKENAEYIKENLKHLTRFKKSKIEILNLDGLKVKPKEFEKFKIVVSSNRLDNFVAELAKCSRNKAMEYMLLEKVFVNNSVELKVSKKIKVNDVITIRGKGKFIVCEFVGNNKKEKEVYIIKKYI